MGSLKNKIILITGGSKGIGYGVAEALLKEGCKGCHYQPITKGSG